MELKEVVKYVSELQLDDYIPCFDGIWKVLRIENISEFCVTVYFDCDIEVNLDSELFGSFKGNMTVPKDLKIVTVEYVYESRI